MEVSQEDEADTPAELNTLAGEVDALHDRCEDPAGVGQDEGQE